MLESKCAVRIGARIDFLIELGGAARQLDVQAVKVRSRVAF